MNVELHIERLVLDGALLEADQGTRFRAGMVRELTRLLQHQGLVPSVSGGNVRSLVAPTIQPGVATGPGELGRKVAASIHASLTEPR
jgi:hypothetical protein